MVVTKLLGLQQVIQHQKLISNVVVTIFSFGLHRFIQHVNLSANGMVTKLLEFATDYPNTSKFEC